MECSTLRDINRGTMVKGETVVTYKCVGTESSKISTFDLQQAKILESSSLSNRQHPCSTLPCENVGNWGTNTADKVEQRNFAVSHKGQMTVIVEHLPSSLNVEADWQSENSRD